MKQFFLCVCALLVLFTSLAVAQDLPKSFDIRNKYPHCTNILDQGYCGSCWSFSATQGLSDRFCIATNKSLILSPQYNINCETGDQGGCSGGSTLLAYQWFASNGVDKLSCTNYYSGETQDTGKCPTTCDDSSPITLYHAQKGYSLKASTSKETVHNIMRDVIENGPVSVSFIVYTDFTSFFQSNPNGVYFYTGGSARGGHAVKVVGWGTTAEGVDYWIIANSWGTSFADGGYFKIRRGTNECTIESRLISAGLPNLNRRTNMIKPIPSYASEFTDEDRAVIDGAFQEIPIDQEVYEVFEHVLSQEQVKSDRVIGIKKAYSQVANGINFKLDIAVKSPSAANKKSSDTNSNGESVVTVVVHKPHGPSAKMQITKFQ